MKNVAKAHRLAERYMFCERFSTHHKNFIFWTIRCLMLAQNENLGHTFTQRDKKMHIEFTNSVATTVFE